MAASSRVAALGLYRSGSTALAGVLHHLGVDLGPPFFEDYYESAWLAQELRRWWDEPSLEEKVSKSERIGILTRWIEERERRGAGWVGAKHPLLALCGEDLLGAWGPQTRFLWSFRPLEASVRSLHAKGWFPNAERMQRRLWNAVAPFFQGQEHLRVEFAAMLTDPAGQVERIIDYLRMSPTRAQVLAAVQSVQPAKSLFGQRTAGDDPSCPRKSC